MSGLLVISPHLDDGALSCGQLLAGHAPAAVLATVCTGVPEVELSAYDRECGFSSSREAVGVRHAEDLRAALVLNVQPVHLGVLDGQYRQVGRDTVHETLAPLLEEIQPSLVAIPLGLLHPDHIAVSDAAWTALERAALADRPTVLLYEEMPYRVVDPQQAQYRLGRWGDRGRLELVPQVLGPLEVKRAAVACYQSQRTPEWETCTFAPERFWVVHPLGLS